MCVWGNVRQIPHATFGRFWSRSTSQRETTASASTPARAHRADILRAEPSFLTALGNVVEARSKDYPAHRPSPFAALTSLAQVGRGRSAPAILPAPMRCGVTRAGRAAAAGEERGVFLPGETRRTLSRQPRVNVDHRNRPADAKSRLGRHRARTRRLHGAT